MKKHKGKYYKLLEKFNNLIYEYGLQHFPAQWENRKPYHIEIRNTPFFHMQVVDDRNSVHYFTQNVPSLEAGCKEILQYIAKRSNCKSISELEIHLAVEFGI